ncbi:MAG: hypothetical protein AAFZ65_20220, partial [Planctomycetota bacterium]
MTGGAPGPALASQLRNVCVGLRSDLVVARHVFRGEPSYVLRDPLTFTTQRFEPEDYALMLRIRPSRTLGQLFIELVDEGWLDLEDEDSFYQFVLELHQSRLLKLPVADDKVLLKRAVQRRKQERRSLWMSPLFYKRKLFDPDEFLSRTEHLVRPLFTRWAFAIWVVTVGAALVVASIRADELVAPLSDSRAALHRAGRRGLARP